MLFTGEAWVKTEPIENYAKIKKIDVLKIFQAVPATSGFVTPQS